MKRKSHNLFRLEKMVEEHRVVNISIQFLENNSAEHDQSASEDCRILTGQIWP